jgi:hypothetical protein
MSAVSDLLDRNNWLVRSYPPTFPQPPEACAALAVMTKLGEVHLLLNPGAAEPCSLDHLPGDVERLVQLYVSEGPDDRWNPLAGGHGHATFLSPGDITDSDPGKAATTVDELQAALRRPSDSH